MNNVARKPKRRVTSCLACYNKKQRCNRRHPCNHCTQRRRPEACVYRHSPEYDKHPSNTTTDPRERDQQASSTDELASNFQCLLEPVRQIASISTHQRHIVALTTLRPAHGTCTDQELELPELFGYSEKSGTNTLGLLLHTGGFGQPPSYRNRTLTVPSDTAAVVKHEMSRMPARSTMDFLLQIYFTDVDWMLQFIDSTSFMAYYESWWAKQSGQAARNEIQIVDVDFAVLVLRICLLASQFLPSPSFTVDSIRGMPLAQVRTTCNTIANSLDSILEAIYERGSLFRVQHTCVTAFNLACEGRLDLAWKQVCNSVQIAQGLGYLSLAFEQSEQEDQVERQLILRLIYNLYSWDGLLSQQLDRTSSFPIGFNPENLPHSNQSPEVESGAHMPDLFLERILHARLVGMWARLKRPWSSNTAVYEPIEAQELHDRLQMNFSKRLPPSFAFDNPNCKWDEHSRHLPKQRQLLRAAFFNTICHIFRPLLLLRMDYILAMPMYKQVLLASQTNMLAIAALNMLDASSQLHALMGTMHTRLPAVTIYPFESAVILACLCIRRLVLSNDTVRKGAEVELVTRERCVAAVEDTLTRLLSLANINVMADSAARSLSRLISIIQTPSPSTGQAACDNQLPWDPHALDDDTESILQTCLPDNFDLSSTSTCDIPEWVSFNNLPTLEFPWRIDEET